MLGVINNRKEYSMYNITYTHHGVEMSVMTGSTSIFSLLTIIDNAKLDFTVSDIAGRITPSQLGFGYFEYWQKG
jgi:hypothetical protein